MMNVHITRRNFIQGLGLLSAQAALAACERNPDQAGTDGPVETASPMLAIIHTNDTHGHDVEVPSTDDSDGNFSMAAVAQLKADWEAKGYDVLLVDAGDATQGMPLVDQSLGEAAISFMNSCAYDLMAVGNHEFDRGEEQIAKYEDLATFPLISANVSMRDSGEPRFEPARIFDLSDGSKVGFFGLTTPETLTSAQPKHAQHYTFLAGQELYACAQAQVDELRQQGCNLVVCVGHLGNEEACKPNTSRDVLENVTGIDLFIDGHDHALVEEEVGGALLVETACYLYNIGLVVIDNGAPSNESIPYGSYDGIDTATQAIIDDVDAQVQSELAVVLGHTNYFLDGNRAPGVRTQETNLADFCSDAVGWSAQEASGVEVDATVINGGGIRASIEVGDITLGNLKAVFAFSNQIKIVKLTGEALLEALEAGTQNVGLEGAIGAFPQVSGIEYTIDASTEYERGDPYPDSTYHAPASPGSRVTIHDVGGRGWDPDETYSIATNDFICQGGDTYYRFKEAADAETPITCDFDYEALASYLIVACDHEVPEVYAAPQGRITIVGV